MLNWYCGIVDVVLENPSHGRNSKKRMWCVMRSRKKRDLWSGTWSVTYRGIIIKTVIPDNNLQLLSVTTARNVLDCCLQKWHKQFEINLQNFRELSWILQSRYPEHTSPLNGLKSLIDENKQGWLNSIGIYFPIFRKARPSFFRVPWRRKKKENISLYCLISLAYFRLLFKLSLIRSSTTRGSGTSILSRWSLQ